MSENREPEFTGSEASEPYFTEGVTGLPGTFRSWYHRMAVAPHPDDPNATLYRDRLEFDAGPSTLAMWPGMWALWQWRGLRLKQLAPSFDELPPEQADDAD